MFTHRIANRVIRRFIAFLAIIVVLVGGASRPAQAQFGFGGVVYDPRNFAQAVLLYRQVLNQLTLQRQQLTAQITAMRKLAAPPWRSINAAIAQVDAITRQGQAISYSLSNVDAAFRATFPGTANTSAYPAAEQLQSTRTLETLRATIDAAQRTATEFSIGVGVLTNLKQQVRAVQGHEQALELNGAIGVYSAEQLTLLAQQMAALTNAQSVYFAHDVNGRAQTQANVRAFFTQMGTIPPSRPGFSFRVNNGG